MNRRDLLRGFAVTAAGLLMPISPEIERAYSFIRPVRRAPMVRFYSGENPERPAFARAADCAFEIPLDRDSLRHAGTAIAREMVAIGAPGSFVLLHDAFGKTICSIDRGVRDIVLCAGDSATIDLVPDYYGGFPMNAALDAA